MITITRRQALQLRSILRRAFGSRGTGPAVCFTADAGTLSARARSTDAAVEFRMPHAEEAPPLWLPMKFLEDCAGKRDEPVHVEPTGQGRATAQWRDGNVPQIVQYDSAPPLDADKFPSVPEAFTENPGRLLRALADAGETCDPDNSRHALACMQLRGPQGTIGAADGRQLLVQSGFTFPWEGDMLVPRSKVFASAELPEDQPVLVGQAGDWVAFRVGAWTFWLAVNKDGRFPDLSRHILPATDATARCRLTEADAAFLTQSLPRLPCDDVQNNPVTLDLNGHVAIRAKAGDQACPTELVLSGSSWSGAPIRLNMNRKFLARAAKLGFQELCVYGNTSPVLCQDDQRQYLWAVLTPDDALKPADNAIRIESPAAAPAVKPASVSPSPQPKSERKVSPVSEPAINTNGTVASNGNSPVTNGHKANGTSTNCQARKAKASQQDLAGLIQRAILLRAALHDLTHQTADLVKALRQHGRQNRAVQQTLAQLRQLKTLGV